MLYDLIFKNAQEWLLTERCPVKPLFGYINRAGYLREAQIQALLVYLYLKIAGVNKPLSTLFSEGFFICNQDLSALNINQETRSILENDTAARALFDLSRLPLNKKNGPGKKDRLTLFPELESFMIKEPSAIDYKAVGKSLFYGVGYSDYLFSLPMGAGKTFLMAAIIYLDLYFALNEPDNPQFAHNFLILVPSGLKSSIIPSLKTIERFDPSWILPEPAAGNIKRMIKFEVLDQPKSTKKNNRARHPNAQKIAGYQPFDSLTGLIMVVNAEKVILDRLGLTAQGELFECHDDEKDRFANELRNIIGKIPHLQIHIDEVHHAATDDIKLRQVVNRWSAGGTINSVLGFSGTPYLGSGDNIKISADIQLKFTQIANTVFYYPLTTAVEKFLKKPRVEETRGLTSIQIIENGVTDFLKRYGNTVYTNGSPAKLAIYCGNIERLEEEVYPHLIGKMKINPEEILKYHRGNKKYKIARDAETEFNSLDTPLSKKKIILLVQIGKEGWDCRSLTGVILSQKGDCPTNMVLQTSCRCLRQVDKGGNETAVIWLNEENARTLDKQLKEEQHTSIQELTSIGKEGKPVMLDRFSRMEYLKLPKIDFYQLNVEYETVVSDGPASPGTIIPQIDPKDHFDTAAIVERGLSRDDLKKTNLLETIAGETADFGRWLFDIARDSLGTIAVSDLHRYEEPLARIFNAISDKKKGHRVFNNLFRQDEIKSRIRLAFHRHRQLNMRSEIIPKRAGLLVVEKLLPVEEHDKLYPSPADVREILLADKTGKDRTFHYLPYDFYRSRFELTFLQEAISLASFTGKDLEVYYNGEQHLTEFRIVCYEKKDARWRRIGRYTPDFLVIKRKDRCIHKILIVETKGSGFADQPGFKARRHFVESEFLPMNNEKFGYNRFDYLVLPDNHKMDDNLLLFKTKIETFFEEI